jgi:hypothetical protein
VFDFRFNPNEVHIRQVSLYNLSKSMVWPNVRLQQRRWIIQIQRPELWSNIAPKATALPTEHKEISTR